MGLFEELEQKKYLDPVYGTVSNTPYSSGVGFNCSNPSLFTAEAMILCHQLSWPNYDKFFSDAEVYAEPGLFHRFPDDLSGDLSIDEIIGASALSPGAAQRILSYGKSHFWVFQPQGGQFKPGSWMGRFINVPPYVKHCAGQRLSLLEQILWSIPCILSSFMSGTSDPLLTWVQTRKMKNNYRICDKAISFWAKRVLKRYPRGLEQMMSIYFGENHPFVKYAPTWFM